MPIQLLDKNVCELIAAGEVVERPASVVKELVENAIDAGAGTIEVELKRGGLELIRVTDNGCGIPAQEVPVAFLRHATSKIHSADDLDGIGTLGFRGEALAAICAVARVRLVSRTAQADEAALYRIEGGQEAERGVTGAPQGTSVYVSDLFYNTPARMKFLKKDVHEGNAAQNIVEQLALSHPEIAFRLIRDGRAAFSTTGRGGLASAAFCALPREIAANLLEVRPADSRVQVSGLVSKPQFGRPSRSLQFVFVNDRFVKSRPICAAAEEAGKNLTMAGKHPAFILNVRLPLEEVDINVHPAKTEVRFRSEREVTGCVYAAVKLALSDFATGAAPAAAAGNTAAAAKQASRMAAAPVPGAETPGKAQPFFNEVSGRAFREILGAFEADKPGSYKAVRARGGIDVEVEPEQPRRLSQPTLPYLTQRGEENAPRPLLQEKPEPPLNPPVPAAQTEKPAETEQAREEPFADCRQSAPFARAVQPQETAEAPAQEAAPPIQTVLDGTLTDGQPVMRYIGEALQTYILVQRGEELLLIDKHAAHERILFEKIRETDTGCARQTLLEPVVASVSREEMTAALENTAAFEKTGFVVEEFGDRELAVREIPTYLSQQAAADAVVQMAAQLCAASNDLTNDELEWLLHSSACRAAIKAGHKSSAAELIHLTEEILNSDIPKFCPHGRPVFCVLTRKEIEKRFGRI